MTRALLGLALVCCLVGCERGATTPRAPLGPAATTSTSGPTLTELAPDERAPVRATLALILRGGPFPYPEKDGTVFGNYEGRLPARARGTYHEYTVPTPGTRGRGAHRLITAGTPPSAYYYTRDHYETFVQLTVP